MSHSSVENASRPPGARVLVVDDDPALLEALERTLDRAGYRVRTAPEPGEALSLMRELEPELVLTDLMLPNMDGIELLRRIKELRPQVEVLLITAHASVERAVEAMRFGAYDFIEKPVDRDRLLRTVAKALEKHSLATENRLLRERLAERDGASRFIGVSRDMIEIKRLVAQIAPTDVPVLITGESGTGKEMVADLVHALSTRRGFPLVKISCAAIPETLLESELFGYERGAFTGAGQNKPGRFELAHRSTLFLDEIGDMAPAMQAKLLRVLQDGRLQRLGGTRDIDVDVRIVAATNVDIGRAILERRFREDLYHRLNVIEIHIPPLREKLEDLPLLVAHFLRLYGGHRTAPIESVSPEALEELSRHPWPGNVRELENVIQRALATAPGPVLRPEDLRFSAARGSLPARAAAGLCVPEGTPLAEAQEMLIRDALERAGGDKEIAARLLGVSARTLYRHARRTPAPAGRIDTQTH